MVQKIHALLVSLKTTRLSRKKTKELFEPFVLAQNIMNQKKFTLRQTIKRRQRWDNIATFSLMIKLRGDVLFEAIKQAERDRFNERNLARRSRKIRNVDFNLNILSELDYKGLSISAPRDTKNIL